MNIAYFIVLFSFQAIFSSTIDLYSKLPSLLEKKEFFKLNVGNGVIDYGVENFPCYGANLISTEQTAREITTDQRKDLLFKAQSILTKEAYQILFDNRDDSNMLAQFYNTALDVLMDKKWRFKLYTVHIDFINMVLVETGVDVQACNTLGETPLHTATRLRDSQVMEHLIRKGALKEARDRNGLTPFLLACTYRYFEGCDLLIRNNVDTSVVTSQGGRPLHFLVSLATEDDFNVEKLKFYIEYFKQDINAKDHNGYSVLHYFVFSVREATQVKDRTVEVLRSLIKCGANTEAKDNAGRTCIHHSMERLLEQFSVVFIEECKPDVNSLDRDGNTPLHALSEFSHSPSSDRGYDVQNRMCRFLLTQGANVDAQNNSGDAPIDISIRKWNTRLFDFLIRKGADKAVQNRRTGQRPLHIATIKIEADSFDSYLTFGYFISRLISSFEEMGKPEYVDSFGNLPIHYWCRKMGITLHTSQNTTANIFTSADRTTEPTSLLGVKTLSGWTILHIAAYHNNLRLYQDLLIWPSQFDKLINCEIPESGKTALMIACEFGYSDICSLIISRRKLKKNKRDKMVGTALDWACEFGREEICRKLLESGFAREVWQNHDKVSLFRRVCGHSKTLTKLIINAWDINTIDEDGNTVLHISCREGFTEVVDAILAYSGILIQKPSKNKQGKTPYDLSRENAHAQILTLLSRAGMN